MATLLDTSALVVFLRRRRDPGHAGVAAAARDALEAGRALVSVVTPVELLVGGRDEGAVARLAALLSALPVVAAGREVGELAGRLGAAARAAGSTIPVPDLLIAATAIWLDVPLLTCDADFGRGRALDGRAIDEAGSGEASWSSLRLHPASRAEPGSGRAPR